jgi:hypothetical protein
MDTPLKRIDLSHIRTTFLFNTPSIHLVYFPKEKAKLENTPFTHTLEQKRHFSQKRHALLEILRLNIAFF